MMNSVSQYKALRILQEPWYLRQAAGLGVAIILRIVGWVRLSNVFVSYSLSSIGVSLAFQVFDTQDHNVMVFADRLLNRVVPSPNRTGKISFVAALILSHYFPRLSITLAVFSGTIIALTRDPIYNYRSKAVMSYLGKVAV